MWWRFDGAISNEQEQPAGRLAAAGTCPVSLSHWHSVELAVLGLTAAFFLPNANVISYQTGTNSSQTCVILYGPNCQGSVTVWPWASCKGAVSSLECCRPHQRPKPGCRYLVVLVRQILDTGALLLLLLLYYSLYIFCVILKDTIDLIESQT